MYAIQIMEMGLTARSAKITIICKKDKKGLYTMQRGRCLYKKMLSSRSAKIFITCKIYRRELNNTKGQMIVEKAADFNVSDNSYYLQKDKRGLYSTQRGILLLKRC